MAIAETGAAAARSTDLGAGRKPRGAADRPAPPAEQEAPDLSALRDWLDSRQPEDRQADVSEVGKELARVFGARLAAQMLKETPLSLREIQQRFGFDPAALSRMANGKTETGPTLWKLFALAEALGFDIHMSLSRK